VGVYVGYMNQINFGAYMGRWMSALGCFTFPDTGSSTRIEQIKSDQQIEKGLTMKAGQTPVQRYWHTLLQKVQEKVRAIICVVPERSRLRSAGRQPTHVGILRPHPCICAPKPRPGARPAHRHHARDALGGGGRGLPHLQRQEGACLSEILSESVDDGRVLYTNTYKCLSLTLQTALTSNNNNKFQDGCVKVVLHPKSYMEDYSGMGEGSMERETSL
jgi:hypothetical protein